MTYQGKQILLVTKHQKEKAIKRSVQERLQAQLISDRSFDTDTLGTFTGEVERTLSPLETVKMKVIKGLKGTPYHYAIATEGSFYPHPNIPFVMLHHEIMVFYDQIREQFIFESYSTADTNFHHIDLLPGASYHDFCKTALFPTHALIIRARNQDQVQFIKGIKSYAELEDALDRAFAFSQQQCIRIETDMRAMFNPSRMSAIEKLSEKLMLKVITPCPECGVKGFGDSNYTPGLPCEACQAPTTLTKSHEIICSSCHYTLSETLGKYASAAQCLYCNP